uniref:Structural maintenance of chromosomes protein 6 n=1 Tax=Esox lucius TaxID=8010 RepID=A0A3P8YQ33_ESOLU
QEISVYTQSTHIVFFFKMQSSGEVGIVESISLKNFMCHSMLGPFTFGPNVNFVVGNNGSGKSAVLTALMVGLGGKATTTNRGSSLKGFVKEGESSADVSITLRNRGKDAYKPELFGQAIIVDLKINREGLRTYKLKSQAGQLVSGKKEELSAILDHFNIQVDNPVSMLTQEMSKHFLHSKGEGDKYKFFMKATQLEQMKEDYSYIKLTKGLTENNVIKHEECLEQLKKKYLEKEERFKSLSSLDEMHSKLEELKNQMAWALVGGPISINKHLFLFLSIHCKLGPMCTRLKYPAKVVEAERKYKAIREQLEALTLRVQLLQPECATLKNEAQSRNKAFNTAQVRVQGCVRRHIEWPSEVCACSSTFLRREKKDQEGSMNAIKRKIENMEGSRSDRLRRFGENMPALLADIEDAHRKGQFRKKPVGPLGYCIRLNDHEQAQAVECCLGALMVAFTCDNHDDEKQLQRLMRDRFQPGKRPQIITSPFFNRVHDTSQRAVYHSNYPSVLQSLEIEDPVVANCLIDQRGIECILLIKDKTECRRVMNGRQPPRNCRMAFTKEGDQCYTDRYYSSDQRRYHYLSKDVEDEIRYCVSVVPHPLKEKLPTCPLYPISYCQHVSLPVSSTSFMTTEKLCPPLLQDDIMKLQQEISELQNVEEPQSEDLNPLEEELEEINCKISAARVDCEEAQGKMAQLKASWEEAEQRYRQHKESISTLAEEADPIKEELSKTDQEVEKSKHHKKHYEEKRKTHINTIKAIKACLQLKEQELTVPKATEICPERSDVRRAARSLDSEITRLKQKISTQQDQQGDREEIIRQYQEALQNYNNINQQVKGLKRFIVLLSKIMDDRHQAYTELRRLLSLRCKMYFDSMLSQRGYMGKMIFDTNTLLMYPCLGDKAALSDMRSLSGGERSFSTVCFVLSLWAIAEAPFRALDEFDVYMDMVNRRISMDMMLKIAASQRYRQFIFLTPQSMSSLPVNNLIRILRLDDPDRGFSLKSSLNYVKFLFKFIKLSLKLFLS